MEPKKSSLGTVALNDSAQGYLLKLASFLETKPFETKPGTFLTSIQDPRKRRLGRGNGGIPNPQTMGRGCCAQTAEKTPQTQPKPKTPLPITQKPASKPT